jgi:hypothetical protein
MWHCDGIRWAGCNVMTNLALADNKHFDAKHRYALTQLTVFAQFWSAPRQRYYSQSAIYERSTLFHPIRASLGYP